MAIRLRRIALVFGALAVISTASAQSDSPFGPADPARFDTPPVPAPGTSYARTLQPLIDRRCTVCHACYDAPCQLKTASWEGLARGANKKPVYDATRLLAASPTRLHVDAHKTSEWRKKDFFPVLNEHAQTPEASRALSVMQRMLALKQRQPWPAANGSTAKLDLSPERSNICPAENEMDSYEQSTPLAGMPFGLPALSAEEHQRLSRWLERGAPYEGAAALSEQQQAEIARWEAFFNGNSLKQQLFARYAYEHLFLAHLYFEGDSKARRYFKLVRSSTPPGKPVRMIATPRPVDNPGVARVWYRLVPELESIVAKTHLPYRLDDQRMARWRELFLTPVYTVKALPGYSEDTAANPFATFAALPVGARYRFMLDEAEFTIMGFIKGPVCRGQLALNVIEDQFWVAFLAPSALYDSSTDALLREEKNLVRLPTGSSNTGLLGPWLKYGQMTLRYNQARNALVVKALQRPENLTLKLIWDGRDGSGTLNDNAALTVFRHFDSASVVKGFVGDVPKTAWVIGYPLLERIHYLLVANYDVYGNLGHQANSRLYMDYLRAEGEFNFLAFLPQAQRIPVRDHWYRNVDDATRQQVYGGPSTTLDLESGVRYKTQDARMELMQLLKKRLAPAASTRQVWQQRTPEPLRSLLQPFTSLSGNALQWMPESTLLVVDLPDGKQLNYTLLRNTAHASVTHLLGEKLALLPEENTLSLLPGIVSAYPNAFYRARARELPELAAAISRLKSEQDYAALAQRWAVRRDSADFWAFSDALHERQAQDEPVSSGILDYNRLEYR